MANLNEIAAILQIEDIEVVENNLNQPTRKFHVRDNPFEDLADIAFKKLFRLTKPMARNLVEILEPYLEEPTRISALSASLKVLTALRFFASGSYQACIGSNVNFAISQASVSRCIAEVSDALNRPEIFNEHVQFPRTFQALNDIRLKFFQKYEFPGIIGIIDCTHVAIVPPKVLDNQYPEHVYVNRKLYHSINVQLICDHNLKILNVNSRFPGSTHDVYVWQMSNVSEVLERVYRNRHGGYYLLGDSGYPLRPWLLTPITPQPEPDTPESRFNAVFKRIRSAVERCNGVLKMRFRCLLKHRVLHYTPERCSKIINSCVVLHNMCINNNLPYPQEEEGEELDFGMMEVPPVNVLEVAAQRVNPDLAAARRIRSNIVNQYFNN